MHEEQRSEEIQINHLNNVPIFSFLIVLLLIHLVFLWLI